MSAPDAFSGSGVTLILLAFIGNLLNRLGSSDLIYLLLNLAGGILATVGALLLNSLPFVVLETTWTVASLIGLVKRLRTPTR